MDKEYEEARIIKGVRQRYSLSQILFNLRSVKATNEIKNPMKWANDIYIKRFSDDIII